MDIQKKNYVRENQWLCSNVGVYYKYIYIAYVCINVF